MASEGLSLMQAAVHSLSDSEKGSQEGLPELMRMAGFKDATDAERNEDLGYGKLLSTVQLYQADGSIPSVHTANPFPLLYKAFAQAGSFTELVMESVLKTNCTAEDPHGIEAVWKLLSQEMMICSIVVTWPP